MAVCTDTATLIFLSAPGNPSAFSLLPGDILTGIYGGTLCSTHLHVGQEVYSSVCSEGSLPMYHNCTFDNTGTKSLLSERGISVPLWGAVLAENKGSPKHIS